MDSILYIMLSGIPMFVCGFWALNLLLQYSYSHQSKHILFWFMLTATILYFAHFVVFNHLYNLIPLTDTLYTFATLSVYPIFFLYILSLTCKVKRHYYLILLPSIVIASVVGMCYLLIPRDMLGDFLLACHYETYPLPEHIYCRLGLWSHKIMKPIIILEIIPILYVGFKKLSDFKGKVRQYYSNTEHRDLHEVKILLILFVVTSCFSVAADLIGRAYFVGSILLISLPTISFGILLFAIGHYGNIQQFTIDDLKAEEETEVIIEAAEKVEVEKAEVKKTETAVKEVHPSAPNESTNAPTVNDLDNHTYRTTLKQQIDRIMENEELFLQPDLKLSDLAIRLHTNRTYIYEALKTETGEGQTLSFPDYVNRFRIAYCLKLFHEGNYEGIESVIYVSGFISRTTFYKNFKKFTGKTPSQYLEAIKGHTNETLLSEK